MSILIPRTDTIEATDMNEKAILCVQTSIEGAVKRKSDENGDEKSSETASRTRKQSTY